MKLMGRLGGGNKKPEGIDPEALRKAARPERRRPRDGGHDVNDRVERLNELAVLSLFLHSAGTMEEMLALFLERSPRVTGAVVTYPLLLDRRRDLLHASPLTNVEDAGIEQACLAANVNLADAEFPLALRSWRREVMEGGEVAVADDLRQIFEDGLDKEACDQIKKQLQISRVAVVPLVMEGETFGLCVFMYSGYEPDIEILELVAGHCTLALKDLMGGDDSTRYGGIEPVTWVYTRRHFLESLEQEVMRSRRYGRGLSVIVFDIDDFGEFNANYGHTLGDRVLRSVAMTLAGSVAPPEIVARYGGDEFAVLLPETNRAAAVQLTASIVSKLASLSVFDGAGGGDMQSVSASAAIVSYPEDGGTRDELLASAEIGIEQSKEDRRAAQQPERARSAVQQLRMSGRRANAA
ncbi:MAG TPA: GGDEF domain-containing protein [Dehalococcoidia bacterium]|jgi:diguanylate cyclase (GGDEF)-like protein